VGIRNPPQCSRQIGDRETERRSRRRNAPEFAGGGERVFTSNSRSDARRCGRAVLDVPDGIEPQATLLVSALGPSVVVADESPRCLKEAVVAAKMKAGVRRGPAAR
jgi:hypothetical protein